MFRRPGLLAVITAVLPLCFSLAAWGGSSTMVGGPCRYEAFPGKATIVSVTPQPDNNGRSHPVRVTYTFRPDNPTNGDPLVQSDAVHTLTLTGGTLPEQAFVDTHGLSTGRVLPCILQRIRQGTCTPVLFDFPGIDLTDHGHTE